MERRPIEDAEGLWRDVYRSEQKQALQKKRANRNAKTAFGTGRTIEARMSVNAYDTVPLNTATASADARANIFAGKDFVQGWWVMNAGDIRAAKALPVLGICHAPLELEDNPHHTEIVTSVGEPVQWDEAKQMLHELLAAGSWQDPDRAVHDA